MNLHQKIDHLEAQFAAREDEVQAYLPEENRFARLRQEVDALESAYPDPEARPPLYGLIVGVKDIFHVDGFLTRAGTALPADLFQGEQAALVTLVKESGAPIAGKTHTTEFAYFAPAPTRNPHNLAHTPGGSSSGSAAAVAAGLCDLAFGTQTIGSITRPAAFCGVVGFKPSFGRMSREGVIPLSSTVDQMGFFTSDVQTAQQAAEVLVDDWVPVDKPKAGEYPRLGVPLGRYLERTSAEGMRHFRTVTQTLHHIGYEIVRVPAMTDFAGIEAAHKLIVAYDALQVHREWYYQHHAKYHPKTRELIEQGSKYSAHQADVARQSILKIREHLTRIMDEHEIDIWISPPAVGSAPLGLEHTGDPIMNLPWTHAGFPTLCLPAGTNDAGLPLGLQLAGRFHTDEQLLVWGDALSPHLSP